MSFNSAVYSCLYIFSFISMKSQSSTLMLFSTSCWVDGAETWHSLFQGNCLLFHCSIDFNIYIRVLWINLQDIYKDIQSSYSTMDQPHTWSHLVTHHAELQKTHLRELLKDQNRNSQLLVKHSDIVLDLSHEKIDVNTLGLLQKLADQIHLKDQLQSLFNGKHINFTQDRAVLHTCLRAPLNSTLHTAELNPILKDVHEVLERIKHFSAKVRSGELKGATGKALTNLIVIGIGGSYLSIQFVYEALRCHPAYSASSKGRKIRFLANVDPIDLTRATQGLDVQQTLILINSKTFTTAQTILNAKSCKKWLLQEYEKRGITDANLIARSHICACSTNLKLTSEFGIDANNVFGFWDFVGGRFSVWSAIGVLPLSVHFGYDVMEQFLKGGHSIDHHLLGEKDIKKNLPLLLGLVGFYRTSIQKHSARAIIPYCQALSKFAPHIQQLDMQSNGKRINIKGQQLGYQTAVVNFGEPGTNGQHSFFQLLHQGRVIPTQFIGFTKSQCPFSVQGEAVNNHDQLMSNFFSQPDALACGKTVQELEKEKVPANLIKHKQFPGDRPSLSILFLGELNAFKCGQLLALYEHRTSIQGFIWEVNSYDQWGVELGKVLAKKMRQMFQHKKITNSVNSATQTLAQVYLDNQ